VYVTGALLIRIAAAAALLLLLLVNPALGLAVLFVWLARRHLAVYVALWRRLLGCEVYTPAISALGLAAAVASPYTGAAKAVLLALGGLALYAAPLTPRLARFVAVLTAGLSAEVPLKPLLIVAATAAAYYAHRAEACGYICVKAAAAPTGDLAYSPRLGAVCGYARGGSDLADVWLRIGGRYARCLYLACFAVAESAFRSGVGPVDTYLPDPSREDFKNVVHVAAPLDAVLKIAARYFEAVVVLAEGVQARRTRLISVSIVDPEVAAELYCSVFRLGGEERELLKELLRRGSRDEVVMWSQRYPWLKPLAELWDGGEEPSGVVKSSLDGRAGVFESLLYAYVKKVPVLTDSEEVARLAEGLGVVTLLTSSRPVNRFLVAGPASVKLPEGEVEVGAGRFILYVEGRLYGGEI